MAKIDSLGLTSLIFVIGIIIGILAAQTPTPKTYTNGTFVKNGTDDWHYLQSKDYNTRKLMEYYDLNRVIAGNFCSGNGYITDISQWSAKIQCCLNYTSCEGYLLVNKQIKEIEVN